LSRTDGWLLIGLFVVIMAWSIHAGVNNKTDHLAVMVEQELQAPMSMARAITYVVFGLILLVISSQILVWGGVEIARALGISDLIIGLTVVAVGTSLPELAASIAAVRKNEHDLALGNIIGSNLFNTSIVIGITGTIGPTILEPGILSRDLPVLGILTAALFLMGYAFRERTAGIISRLEGVLLLIAYLIYNAGLVLAVINTKS